jgi:hypothetical protein
MILVIASEAKVRTVLIDQSLKITGFLLSTQHTLREREARTALSTFSIALARY